MKRINTLLTLLFISFLSSTSWSETLGDLVFRDGLYFKKFTDVPLTGEVTGNPQGSFKSGQREGDWRHYYENGQLRHKGTFKNNMREGMFVYYNEDGSVKELLTGTYENDYRINN